MREEDWGFGAPRTEEDWGDLGVVWTEEKKEEFKLAILKVRKLEGLD